MTLEGTNPVSDRLPNEVKVSLVRCGHYRQSNVDKAIRKALNLIGGLEGIIKRGHRVLVKPNMLSARPPERAVTTHPSLLRAVVEMLKELGAEPLIGDSPGGINRDISEFWQVCGYREVSEITGVPLVDLERNLEEIEVPQGRIYKSLHLPRIALEVDALISLPKLKTHNLTLYTGAVKNLLGLIPGLGKSEFHKRCPRPDDFGEAIVDILSVVKPKLSIIDGVVAMEGNGPVSPHLRNMGLILASRDAVALDTIVQAIVGLKPFDVPTTAAAVKRGLGIGDLERIEIVGEPLEEVVADDFQLPSNAVVRSIPKPILTLIARGIMVKPTVDKGKCTRCQSCLENCPVKAISADDYPRVDYKRCILCLCCYELCPQNAIQLRRSLLAKLWI